MIPALVLAVDLDDEDVRGRCIGSRADSGVPPALSLRRIEKVLMFGSKSGRTSSVGLDHGIAVTRRLDDELVPSLDELGVCPGEPPASARSQDEGARGKIAFAWHARVEARREGRGSQTVVLQCPEVPSEHRTGDECCTSGCIRSGLACRWYSIAGGLRADAPILALPVAVPGDSFTRGMMGQASERNGEQRAGSPYVWRSTGSSPGAAAAGSSSRFNVFRIFNVFEPNGTQFHYFVRETAFLMETEKHIVYAGTLHHFQVTSLC